MTNPDPRGNDGAPGREGSQPDNTQTPDGQSYGAAQIPGSQPDGGQPGGAYPSVETPEPGPHEQWVHDAATSRSQYYSEGGIYWPEEDTAQQPFVSPAPGPNQGLTPDADGRSDDGHDMLPRMSWDTTIRNGGFGSEGGGAHAEADTVEVNTSDGAGEYVHVTDMTSPADGHEVPTGRSDDSDEAGRARAGAEAAESEHVTDMAGSSGRVEVDTESVPVVASSADGSLSEGVEQQGVTPSGPGTADEAGRARAGAEAAGSEHVTDMAESMRDRGGATQHPETTGVAAEPEALLDLESAPVSDGHLSNMTDHPDQGPVEVPDPAGTAETVSTDHGKEFTADRDNVHVADKPHETPPNPWFTENAVNDEDADLQAPQPIPEPMRPVLLPEPDLSPLGDARPNPEPDLGQHAEGRRQRQASERDLDRDQDSDQHQAPGPTTGLGQQNPGEGQERARVPESDLDQRSGQAPDPESDLNQRDRKQHQGRDQVDHRDVPYPDQDRDRDPESVSLRDEHPGESMVAPPVRSVSTHADPAGQPLSQQESTPGQAGRGLEQPVTGDGHQGQGQGQGHGQSQDQDPRVAAGDDVWAAAAPSSPAVHDDERSEAAMSVGAAMEGVAGRPESTPNRGDDSESDSDSALPDSGRGADENLAAATYTAPVSGSPNDHSHGNQGMSELNSYPSQSHVPANAAATENLIKSHVDSPVLTPMKSTTQTTQQPYNPEAFAYAGGPGHAGDDSSGAHPPSESGPASMFVPRMLPQFVWEGVLLVLFALGVVAYMLTFPEVNLLNRGMSIMAVSGAAMLILAVSALSVSARAGAINLGVPAVVVAAPGIFIGSRHDFGPEAAWLLLFGLAIVVGIVMALLVLMRVPAWLTGLLLTLGMAYMVRYGPHSPSGIGTSDPHVTVWVVFGGACALSIIGGLVASIKPLRRTFVQTRFANSGAQKHNMGTVLSTMAALVASTMIAVVAGMIPPILFRDMSDRTIWLEDIALYAPAGFVLVLLIIVAVLALAGTGLRGGRGGVFGTVLASLLAVLAFLIPLGSSKGIAIEVRMLLVVGGALLLGFIANAILDAVARPKKQPTQFSDATAASGVDHAGENAFVPGFEADAGVQVPATQTASQAATEVDTSQVQPLPRRETNLADVTDMPDQSSPQHDGQASAPQQPTSPAEAGTAPHAQTATNETVPQPGVAAMPNTGQAVAPTAQPETSSAQQTDSAGPAGQANTPVASAETPIPAAGQATSGSSAQVETPAQPAVAETPVAPPAAPAPPLWPSEPSGDETAPAQPAAPQAEPVPMPTAPPPQAQPVETSSTPAPLAEPESAAPQNEPNPPAPQPQAPAPAPQPQQWVGEAPDSSAPAPQVPQQQSGPGNQPTTGHVEPVTEAIVPPQPSGPANQPTGHAEPETEPIVPKPGTATPPAQEPDAAASESGSGDPDPQGPAPQAEASTTETSQASDTTEPTPSSHTETGGSTQQPYLYRPPAQ